MPTKKSETSKPTKKNEAPKPIKKNEAPKPIKKSETPNPKKKGEPAAIVVDTLNLADLKQPYEVQLIHYTKLLANPKNRYKTEGIEALADSIQAAGVLQPLLVKVVGDGVYTITAGHRRKLAIIMLVEQRGLKQFAYPPCIVSAQDEDETVTGLKLHLTNILNRTLSDYDKMYAISELEQIFNDAKKKGIKIEGKIRDNIGEAMGLGHSQVQKYLTTAKELSKSTKEAEEIKELLQSGIIGITEVYSKIRPKQPDPGEDGEDESGKTATPDASDSNSSEENATGNNATGIIQENKDTPPPLSGQQAGDEPLNELKKTLSEARKMLDAFKKMVTLLKIPELNAFVKNFEKELEKIEKKISQ